jgi:hypothetical protein
MHAPSDVPNAVITTQVTLNLRSCIPENAPGGAFPNALSSEIVENRPRLIPDKLPTCVE